MGVRCFLIEPTGTVSQALRRYTSTRFDETTRTPIVVCPVTCGTYHNAEVRIEDAPAILNAEGYVTNGSKGDEFPHDDPRWPTQCQCGYTFTPDDNWQLFCESLYRNTETGEQMTLKSAPAGAMLRAPWTARYVASQDDAPPLAVKTPGGLWIIDECATDCPYYMRPNERPQGHSCWTRTGTPPNVTANPSIHFPGYYHGWLRDGQLVDA